MCWSTLLVSGIRYYIGTSFGTYILYLCNKSHPGTIDEVLIISLFGSYSLINSLIFCNLTDVLSGLQAEVWIYKVCNMWHMYSTHSMTLSLHTPRRGWHMAHRLQYPLGFCLASQSSLVSNWQCLQVLCVSGPKLLHINTSKDFNYPLTVSLRTCTVVSLL